MEHTKAVVFGIIVILAVSGVIALASSANFGTVSSSSGRRLGFWVGADVMFGDLKWSSQTFVNNYFLTQPYPSNMLWVYSVSGDGGASRATEDAWIHSVCQIIVQNNYNVKVDFLVFVNMGSSTDVQNLQTSLSAVQGLGCMNTVGWESEYTTPTLAEVAQFKSIVNSYGFLFASSNQNWNPDILACYSPYPYFGNTLPTNICGRGYGYGETGVPLAGSTPIPAWTQAVILNIIDNSPVPSSNAYTEIFCQNDANNPAGGTIGHPLWASSTLRAWIWNDPNYVKNYVLSNSAFTTLPHTTTTYPTTSRTFTTTTTTQSQSIVNGTQLQGYCQENATNTCSKQQLTEVLSYPSGTYEIRYTPRYCYPLEFPGQAMPSCSVPFDEPPGLVSNPNWAFANQTVESTELTQSIKLSSVNATLQSISASVPIKSVLYNASVIQIVFPANVTAFLQIKSTRAPTAVYADARPVSWTYSNGVITIAADPDTITMMFGSTAPSWLAFLMQYELEILLAVIVLVAAVAVVIVRRR